MPRVDVTAKAGCLYEGLPRPEGDVFSCELSDARVLKIIGKVEFEDTPAPLTAELPQSAPRRGRYRRRDLVAED